MKTDGSLTIDMHSFDPATEGQDGFPGVTQVPGDSLFGVVRYGGVNNGGSLYSIRKDGSNFTVHHQFETTMGLNPESKLVYFDGKLYGTTSLGGDFNKGTLFCINADGTNYRVICHFTDGVGMWTQAPGGNIAISSDGKIFGAFRDYYFDNTNYWYLYKLDTSGSNFTPFFTGELYQQQRMNGQYPMDVLLFQDEDIYFPTRSWGRHEGGVLNLTDTAGNGSAILQYGYSLNGFHPTGIIKGSDEKLYGVTRVGGTEGSGIIFRMNSDGSSYTRLHELTDLEGFEPSGRLLETHDSLLYGACRQGGANGQGSLYRIRKNGTGFQVIYNFGTTGGYSPVGDLVDGPGGFLYGVTFWPYGSIFRIHRSGTGFTELKVFNTGELTNPYSGLRLSNGYLYGTCGLGGAANYGGIFRIKTDGSGYQVLHEFSGATDGSLPVGSLVLANNGKLYGTTSYGGADDDGIIYMIDTTGANFSVIRDLSPVDGIYPWMGMIQASDGLIYGGTQTGGTTYAGTLFRFALNGSGFTVVRNFDTDTEGAGVASIVDLNVPIILPVELISFEANKKDQTVLLRWKTAQEQNSDRFIVERSSDATHFKPIGTVVAARNTNLVTNYSFTDFNPLKGINYYRLKQIDIDGSFEYSRVESINFNKPDQITLFPNPVSERLMVQLPQGRYTLLRVVNASGQVVLEKTITSPGIVELNVSGLPKGWYSLQLPGEKKIEKTFLKE